MIKNSVEENKKNHKSIFGNKRYLPFLALIAVFSWGCAFPLIKLGMKEFQITASNTGGKTLFAGIRFMLAGIVVIIIAKLQHREVIVKKSKDIVLLFIFALVNTTMHYFCFYIGMSNCYGSRASVLDSLGTFLLVILACVVFKDEHMTVKKTTGCILGVIGILLINVGNMSGGQFTLQGDGMIILNSCCAAMGGILTRVVTRRMDALSSTGTSLFIGGIMLCIIGIILHGTIPQVTVKGIIILLMLVCVSAVGFSIYNQLFKYHSVGNVAIFNSLIPVFGIMLSCIFLREGFQVNYLFAGAFVASGVYVVNKQ